MTDTFRFGRLLPVACAALLAAGAAGCSTTGEDDTTDAAGEEARTTEQAADVEQPLDDTEQRGMELFVQSCGACHTLDAAGTTGSIGPDLNELQADEQRVLRAIRIGGTGSGNMPAGLLEGADAQAVARFVAASGPG